MHHQLVGRPIGKVTNISITEAQGLETSFTEFGPGLLYDPRVLGIAAAIRAGEIEGEVYSDGEVWANPQSLSHYIAEHVPA